MSSPASVHDTPPPEAAPPKEAAELLMLPLSQSRQLEKEVEVQHNDSDDGEKPTRFQQYLAKMSGHRNAGSAAGSHASENDSGIFTNHSGESGSAVSSMVLMVDESTDMSITNEEATTGHTSSSAEGGGISRFAQYRSSLAERRPTVSSGSSSSEQENDKNENDSSSSESSSSSSSSETATEDPETAAVTAAGSSRFQQYRASLAQKRVHTDDDAGDDTKTDPTSMNTPAADNDTTASSSSPERYSAYRSKLARTIPPTEPADEETTLSSRVPPPPSDASPARYAKYRANLAQSLSSPPSSPTNKMATSLDSGTASPPRSPRYLAYRSALAQSAPGSPTRSINSKLLQVDDSTNNSSGNLAPKDVNDELNSSLSWHDAKGDDGKPAKTKEEMAALHSSWNSVDSKDSDDDDKSLEEKDVEASPATSPSKTRASVAEAQQLAIQNAIKSTGIHFKSKEAQERARRDVQAERLRASQKRMIDERLASTRGISQTDKSGELAAKTVAPTATAAAAAVTVSDAPDDFNDDEAESAAAARSGIIKKKQDKPKSFRLWGFNRRAADESDSPADKVEQEASRRNTDMEAGAVSFQDEPANRSGGQALMTRPQWMKYFLLFCMGGALLLVVFAFVTGLT